MLVPCPSALLAIPVHPKHYSVCVCAARPLVYCRPELKSWRWSRLWGIDPLLRPSPASLPCPITRLCVWFSPKATKRRFLVWQKPPPLASQSPCSPFAHSYPPIRQLSSVKTQQSHNAMLYNSGSSHTRTYTHTLWGFHSFTSPRPSFLLRTHTRDNELLLCCRSTSTPAVFSQFSRFLFVLPILACTYIKKDITHVCWRVTVYAHMLRAKCTRDGKRTLYNNRS